MWGACCAEFLLLKVRCSSVGVHVWVLAFCEVWSGKEGLVQRRRDRSGTEAGGRWDTRKTGMDQRRDRGRTEGQLNRGLIEGGHSGAGAGRGGTKAGRSLKGGKTGVGHKRD